MFHTITRRAAFAAGFVWEILSPYWPYMVAAFAVGFVAGVVRWG